MGQSDWGYTTADGETTGGWSGSEASHERAVGDEKSGRAHRRREAVWNVVRLGGLDGATWKEVATALNCHHGSASGALSNLHKAGRIERLKERRGGASVYVLPHAVNERETAKYGRASKPPGMSKEEFDQALADANGEGWQVGYDQGSNDAKEEAYRAGFAAAQDAFEETSRRVKRVGRREVAVEFGNLAMAMQEQLPRGIHAHNAKCWTTHPYCTLTAIRKASERILRENTEQGL